MHRITGILCALLLLSGALFAQSTHIYNDPDLPIREARQWIGEGKHNLAYPVLQQLLQQATEQPSFFSEEKLSWINFYYIQCALHLLLPGAENDAIKFLSEKHHAQLHRMMYYHLGHFYHLRQQYDSALMCFSYAGKESLTNQQIGNLKFEQAYALFNQKNFDQAAPLFEEVMQMENHAYFIAAHYYAGFIYFSKYELSKALAAFETALNAPEYHAVLPYYIAEILYEQGNKERALVYGDSVLSSGAVNYYEKDLQLMIGQIYFEKQSYDKALPLIEAFVNKSSKVNREVMYELSFCYYKAGKTDKAINGFRQLSNEKDSLGQSSMYLLGTLYLNIGDKTNARNAFQYCASVNMNADQQQSARMNYAKLSGELGFQDMALQEMRQFVKDYPSSPYTEEAKEILFNLLAATSNYADGIELYQSIANPPENLRKLYPQLLFGRAVQLSNDQQYTQADTLLGSMLASPMVGSMAPYAHYWKGEIAYRQKKYDAGIKSLQSFVQSNSKSLGEANIPNGKYSLAYCYFQKGNFKNALDLFNALSVNVNSASPTINQDAFLRSADCHFMLRDFVIAGKKYDVVASWNSAQVDYALYQKAMIAGIKNASDKIRLLNELRSRFPNSRLKYDIIMEIAQTLITEKRFNESITYLQDLQNNQDAQRHKPAACQLLGTVYYNLDQPEKSLQSYRELFASYPRSDEANDALPSVRQLFMDQGNPDGYFQFAANYGLNLGVNEADSLLFNASYLHYVTGNYEKAVSGFLKYTTIYTTGVRITDAYFYLGQCYLKKNDTLSAISSFQKNNAAGKSDFYELSTLELGRLYYFQKRMYDSSLYYFQVLYDNASDNENRLEALRGLARCYYRLGKYDNASDKVNRLLQSPGVSADDKIIAWMVLAKSRQSEGKCDSAILIYKNIITISQSYWGGEARYESARCLYQSDKLAHAEKMAMAVINETGSYDYWVTRAYLLLGDIFMRQKDYFNAKATYESLSKNTNDPQVRAEAQRKYQDALFLESRNGKLKN